MKERIHWIDWSKVILIYLVVLAHYGELPGFIDNFICAFHMPAFFIISGYLHKPLPILISIKKNSKRLLIPAFLFSVLCWLFYVCLMLYKHEPYTYDNYISKYLLGMIFYDRPNVTPPCGVIWFIQVLFLSKLLLDILVRYRIKIILLFCVICVVSTWILYNLGIDNKRSLFIIQRTCVSFPFVALGYILKEKNLMKRLVNIKCLLWILLPLYVLGVIYNGRVGIATWRFGYDVLLFYIIAFVGCCSFFLFMNKIKYDGGNAIITVSNGTLVILCLHRLMLIFVYHLHLGPYVGSFIILAICFPLILIFNKYLPVFVGISRK